MKRKTNAETIVLLQIALRAAYDFIDKSPCDPDISAGQWAAWQYHEEARKQITEAELL